MATGEKSLVRLGPPPPPERRAQKLRRGLSAPRHGSHLQMMGILTRLIFRDVASSALLGTVLITFVLFLQRVGKLFEILVRSSAPPPVVGQLFLLAIPFALTFTVPLGVLVGVLISLSRMSSDNEITAMRAAGVSSRKVLAPVLTLAFLGMVVTAASSLYLTPYSISQTFRILNRLVASELTAEVQPRIFEEQFPDRVLYVGDVLPGPVTRWRNVFMADLRPPAERNGASQERGDGPRITVAADAIAIPDVARNRIQLTMRNSSTHEVGKEVTQYFITSAPTGATLLAATKPNEVHAKEYTEMETIPLYREAYQNPGLEEEKKIAARIELHWRLALPPACILLALIGIPLGVSSRKGGKSAAFVLTIALAFIYWTGLIAASGMARQHKLPVGIAVWIPNAVFALLGLVMVMRLESPYHRDWVGMTVDAIGRLWTWLRSIANAPRVARTGRASQRFPLVPQVIDTYILSAFLFYWVVFLVSFVLIFHVYTFFELLSDLVKNHIAMSEMLTYLVFLTPKLIYDFTPVSVLVAVLITFGVLTKHNEVSAFKACGVSLYRLAIPVLVASLFLSGGLFAFDHYYVPEANRKQDALRNKIKGKPVQTYLRPDRKWIFGRGSRIYYYKYFEPSEKVMAGVNVYELDPETFRLTRHIAAERAHWEPGINKWVFENGWSRDWFKKKENLVDFTGQATTFPELTERPDYFLKEVLQDKQMNFEQLAAYIKELQQSGFDTIALQVQFYRKFAVPLFAAIMALLSIPFSFAVGNRGAMAGVGISLGIGIAYIAINILSEQVGNVNLLPAAVAAWSPDVVFTLAGLYFFSRMRT
jgi:LPS export ABC transporter permease LptG/LPS export ABC transporter permease LptF